MDSQFDGTTLIPQDGGTPEDHNKALLDLLGKINEVSKNAASASDLSGDSSSVSSLIKTMSKGLKYGLEISYVSSDTLTVKPGMAEVNGTLAALSSSFSITSSMANFPGAGAWAYVTIESGGTIRLFPATGAATVRPSDNCYQLTGGAVGYDDLKLYGYYYDSKRRIIGAIHRVNATTWYYVINNSYDGEYGFNQYGFWRRKTDGELSQWMRVQYANGLGSYTWTFPIAFPAAFNDYSILSGAENSVGAADIYVFTYGHLITSITGYIRGAGYNTQANFLHLKVIGRWK